MTIDIDTYLEEVKSASDELLKEKYGITDNTTVLMNADFSLVESDWRDMPGYTIIEKHSSDKTLSLSYDAGVVGLQVVPERLWTTGGIFPRSYEREHVERQLRDYTMSFGIHMSQPRKSDIHFARLLAISLEDVVSYARSKRIPFCLPMSGGVAHSEEGASRIVYWQPGD